MIEPRLVVVYKAKYNNSDDGRGADTVEGIYLHERRAVAAVKGKEPYGRNGRVERVLVADLGGGECVEVASLHWNVRELVE